MSRKLCGRKPNYIAKIKKNDTRCDENIMTLEKKLSQMSMNLNEPLQIGPKPPDDLGSKYSDADISVNTKERTNKNGE